MSDDLLDHPLDDVVGMPDLDAAWLGTSRRLRRRRAARLGATGLTAMALLAGATLLAGQVGDAGDETRVATEPAPSPTTTIPFGWTQLPELPIPPRTDAALATMDDGDVFVWGGDAEGGVRRDGAVLDADTGTWDELPPAPPGPWVHPRATWTGEVVLLVQGDGGMVEDGSTLLGWDPSATEWFESAPAEGACFELQPVWTGDELVFACLEDGIARTYEAYDPENDRWRTLPRAPRTLMDRDLVWTGTELLVVGAEEPRSATDWTTHTLAYDPAEDSWRELAPMPIDILYSDASWIAGELVVVNETREAAAYQPSTDTWRLLPELPEALRCGRELLTVDGHVVAFGCDGAAALEPDDTWSEVEAPAGAAAAAVTDGRAATTITADGVWTYRPLPG